MPMINAAEQDNTRSSFRTLIIPTLRFYAGRIQRSQPPTRLHAGGPSRALSCTPFQSAGTRTVPEHAKVRPLFASSVLTLEDEEMLFDIRFLKSGLEPNASHRAQR
jgi:hypothetical protein